MSGKLVLLYIRAYFTILSVFDSLDILYIFRTRRSGNLIYLKRNEGITYHWNLLGYRCIQKSQPLVKPAGICWGVAFLWTIICFQYELFWPCGLGIQSVQTIQNNITTISFGQSGIVGEGLTFLRRGLCLVVESKRCEWKWIVCRNSL